MDRRKQSSVLPLLEIIFSPSATFIWHYFVGDDKRKSTFRQIQTISKFFRNRIQFAIQFKFSTATTAATTSSRAFSAGIFLRYQTCLNIRIDVEVVSSQAQHQGWIFISSGSWGWAHSNEIDRSNRLSLCIEQILIISFLLRYIFVLLCRISLIPFSIYVAIALWMFL